MFIAFNRLWSNKCFNCGPHATVKNRAKLHKQSYLCKSCGKQLTYRKQIDYQRLWREYVYGKQTIRQLSERYCVSHDTIIRYFGVPNFKF